MGGWFAYQELQDQLSANEPVAVPDVDGLTEQLAVRAINDAGLEELVQREADRDVAEGLVVSQDPQPGERIERGNFVTIVVSTGLPKTRVPNVVGQNRDAAVAELADAGLTANVVAVNSLQDVNVVLATDPKSGTELVEGSTVRVNVSKGPKPVTVPNVIGTASATITIARGSTARHTRAQSPSCRASASRSPARRSRTRSPPEPSSARHRPPARSRRRAP